MRKTLRNRRRNLTRILCVTPCLVCLLGLSPDTYAARPALLDAPGRNLVRTGSEPANTGLVGMQSSRLRGVDRTITGKVTDENDQPLPGVSIVVKGSTTGTASKGDGTYALNVKNGSVTLVFSFMGYVAQEVVVGNRTSVDMKLLPNAEQLKEVVVVGYGTQQKKDLTGSVGSISAKDIETSTINTPDKALQGKIAGVQVHTNSHAPGGGISVQVCPVWS